MESMLESESLLEAYDTKFMGLFRGKVVNNNDPLQLRRCQIRAMPMMEGCKDSDLPWAVCRDSRGVDIPEIGSWVYVEFEVGDILKPVYSGYICGPDKKTIPDEAKIGYPDTKVFKANGALIKLDGNGSVTIKSSETGEVIINATKIYLVADLISMADGLGYVVTCPLPGQTIVTQSHVLNSSVKITG